jgi:vacuolar-type H+-ATPase subunit F/Vma7
VSDGKKIAVIGERDFTVGFELAGVSETVNPENYAEEIKKMISSDDIGIIVAEESDVEQLPGRVEREVRSSVDPVVVALSENAEAENLNEKIRKVIGADIT